MFFFTTLSEIAKYIIGQMERGDISLYLQTYWAIAPGTACHFPSGLYIVKKRQKSDLLFFKSSKYCLATPSYGDSLLFSALLYNIVYPKTL